MRQIPSVLSSQDRYWSFDNNHSILLTVPNAPFDARTRVNFDFRRTEFLLTWSRLLGLMKCCSQILQTFCVFRWSTYSCVPGTQAIPSPSSQPWQTIRCCVVRWCSNNFSHVGPSKPQTSHRLWLVELSWCCCNAVAEPNVRLHWEQYGWLVFCVSRNTNNSSG